jgi:hypothetical protein
MTQSLRSIPEPKRQDVAERRVAQDKGGIGTWAAKDYRKKQNGGREPRLNIHNK